MTEPHCNQSCRPPGAAFFWKGRVALFAILKAAKIGPGDAVLVPGYTCVVVPSAVQFAGARPLYVDIDPATYNITLETIEAALGGADPRSQGIRAVVIQHTYGIPVDADPILDWARRHDVMVIEDCCHALGSRYRHGDGSWSEVGSLGDAAFFSSQWSKPLTTGLGGWATARDEHFAAALKQLETETFVQPSALEVSKLRTELLLYKILFRPALYWLALDVYRNLARLGVFIGSSDEEEARGIMPADYAKAMSSMQRQLVIDKLGHLDELLAHRRRFQNLYDRALRDAGLPTLPVPSYADAYLLRYPLRIPNKLAALEKARSLHIELGDWFNHPLHPVGWDLSRLGWQQGMCPQGQQAAAEVVNLPLHRRVSERDVERAVAFLQEHCARHVAAPLAAPAGVP